MNITSFRPLIGVNFCKQIHPAHQLLLHRFRPLIGVNFCKHKLDLALEAVEESSFRPLIGVNFCKHVKEMNDTFKDQVSVPLSGLTSVNSKNKQY